MELFRAYSDESQGRNGKDVFASGAAVSSGNITAYNPPLPSSIDVGQELVDALKWKKHMPSIFVFFSTSLLFATQVARFRKQKGETNVEIACVNTATARTPDGNPAKFWSVSSLVKKYGITLSNKDGSLRDYADIFVAMDCIVPGKDALIASFDEMEQAGLYRVYPAMASGYHSHRPRLALTTQDLREFHFQEEKSLTTGHINIAARVAAVFKADLSPREEQVPCSVFVHVLALRKRHARDVVLTSWLQSCSTEVVDLEVGNDELPVADFLRNLPELEQYRELKSVVGNRHIDAGALNYRIEVGGLVVSDVAQKQEMAEWQAWRGEHIQEMRNAREQRPDYVPKVTSRKRSRSKRSDSTGFDEAEQQEYKRVKREWLPRDEYRAVRDASRGRGERSDSTSFDKTGPSKRKWLPRDECRAQRDASRASRTDVRQLPFMGKHNHKKGFEMPGFETRLFDGHVQQNRSNRGQKSHREKKTRWW
ncbi:hypothetical protein CLAFUW4_01537 [Fulvia fulva]|uniref:DUF7587 domain-containing protein n=1 Tax=Passalora fulva TaxID=5499 RepID=A0A9Q8P3P9_PASFU|nr:uncharacterized protein CLAFUR5_01539 [Fulvia fulva]KAK4636056.1 hypothetical protein CLAFUR4_01538 [Fulvia fulva]KAK4636846.1 hypothetical protein CLAFUR0_01539 [Fulvia fulva]UJO12255.1 hypothetical protein CLAFUR5_01539 [Fulvia fulva]WPV08615.1 hypothetical protein CLAFUW4_01537 [Fulvia fulva]WPV23607.1 hypothetical protein CLAFUW7_01542 [Fulvia fulva]